jgi:hypothetical protein
MSEQEPMEDEEQEQQGQSAAEGESESEMLGTAAKGAAAGPAAGAALGAGGHGQARVPEVAWRRRARRGRLLRAGRGDLSEQAEGDDEGGESAG